MPTNKTIRIKLTNRQAIAARKLTEQAFEAYADGHKGSVFCQIFEDDTAICQFLPEEKATAVIKITNPEWYACNVVGK